jgi:prophage regulatory protein
MVCKKQNKLKGDTMNVAASKKHDRLLRVPQILERVPVSRSWLWRLVKDGKFPQPLRISEKITAWKESDIDNFLENLEAER